MAAPSGFFIEFLVSAAVGGLIGIEREHRDDGLPVIAGVRTFPLVSVGGFLCAAMATQAGRRSSSRRASSASSRSRACSSTCA